MAASGAVGTAALLVPLDAADPRPLFRQLYDGLRAAILEGRLRGGTRLPSTRTLAAELAVARNTVIQAYDQLRTEGYVHGARGGGTRVRTVLPDALLGIGPSAAASPRTSRRSSSVRIAGRAATREADHRRDGHRPPSAAGRRVAAPTAGATIAEGERATAPALSAAGAALASAGGWLVARGGTPPMPFRLGVVSPDTFPARSWARIAAQRWRRGQVAVGELEPGGHPALRAAIGEHVQQTRGVRCTPEQVLVVNGTQQALDLVARVLLEAGDEVWVEDPGYSGAAAVLRAAGARLVPVRVDVDGIDVEAGLRAAPRARLAYATPSHQFPLGAVMSVARRLALLDWARRAESWIFEDDYDSEFRYAGRPLPSLQGLDVERRAADGSPRVLYAGTFNKALAAGLRLGFLVVPPALAGPLAAARVTLDRHSSSFEQQILAEFIGEGHYARHLRAVRALYAERQAALLDAAGAAFGELLTLEPDPAGLHLVGWLPEGSDDAAVAAAAGAAGVEVSPVSAYAQEPHARASRPGLLLGYAAFEPDAIRAGVHRLARVLERTLIGVRPGVRGGVGANAPEAPRA